LAIQYDRLAGHRRRPVLLVRRMLALLAFGLVHLFLIWDGDILTEYALAGLVVLPFLFGPTWAVALGAALSLLFYLAMPALPPLVAFPDVSWLTSHVQAATRVYGTGGFADVLAFRIDEVKAMLTLHVLIFPRTVGLFLLGMLAWRLGIARDAGRHARGLWLAGATGVAIGLVLIVTIGASPYALWPARGAVGAIAASAGTIVLALGYASLVAAAGTDSAGRWLAWAEPVGRMAFTNYVVQSLVLAWIFYGYGLGLFARIGLVDGLALVVAIYVGQVLFSRWWLRRFRYGPLEWLWRTLMYGARLPFRWPLPARHLAGSPPQF
ncbi:MAG: DUF418 domain-containing protein, partial [Alphaproteobacteria bacterium]|nr:DUF418 domain-containing protein [Alphaproteobacteria bacterium]